MNNVKTAISIEKPLYDQAEALAKKKNISRSRLYSLALEEYIQKHQNHALLEKINVACEDIPDSDETSLNRIRHQYHRRFLEGEW